MNKDHEHTLLSKGIRPTAMRLLVLKYLAGQSHAVSLNAIETEMDHSDRITLYRTIKTFQEKGVVHSIEDGTGATKYALCFDECETSCHHDLHIHFYCTTCKETYCLPKTHVPEVTLPAKFQLEEISLMAKGTCDKCRR
jgi:Fur family ferric uptake transcriptional regulator